MKNNVLNISLVLQLVWIGNLCAGMSGPVVVPKESLPAGTNFMVFHQYENSQMRGVQYSVGGGKGFFGIGKVQQSGDFAPGFEMVKKPDGVILKFSDSYRVSLNEISGSESWTTAIGMGKIPVGMQTSVSPMAGNLFIGVTDPNAPAMKFEDISKIGAMAPSGTGAFYRPQESQWFQQMGGVWKEGGHGPQNLNPKVNEGKPWNSLSIPETGKDVPSSAGFFKDYFPQKVVDDIQNNHPQHLSIAGPNGVTRDSLARFYEATDPFQAGGPAMQSYSLSNSKTAYARESHDWKSQIVKPSNEYLPEYGVGKKEVEDAHYNANELNPHSWNIRQRSHEPISADRTIIADQTAVYNNDHVAFRASKQDGTYNHVLTQYELRDTVTPDNAMNGSWKDQAVVERERIGTLKNFAKAQARSGRALQGIMEQYETVPVLSHSANFALKLQGISEVQHSIKYQFDSEAMKLKEGRGAWYRVATMGRHSAHLEGASRQIDPDGMWMAEYANVAPVGSDAMSRSYKSALPKSAKFVSKSNLHFDDVGIGIEHAAIGATDSGEKKHLWRSIARVENGMSGLAQVARLSHSPTGNFYESKQELMEQLPAVLNNTVYHPDRQTLSFRVKDLASRYAENTGQLVQSWGNVKSGADAYKVAAGFVFSQLSGDMWDRQKPQHFGRDGHAVMATNGVLNHSEDALIMADAVRDRTGVERVASVKNGTHIFGLGDFIQIIGHELGAQDITVVRAVNLLQQGIQEKGEVHPYAHSQGSMVNRRGFEKLTPEERSKVHFTGMGNQIYVSAKEIGLASAVNIRNPGDFVAAGNDVMKLTGQRSSNQEWTPGTGRGHSFQQYVNSIPPLR